MSPERKKMPKPEFSFGADSLDVANNIKGARIMVGDLDATIIEAEGYTREQNNRGQYRRLIELNQDGLMVGIPYRNITLPLITTRDGGCVLLLAVDIKDVNGNVRQVDGAGKVGKALGLEKHDVRRVDVEDPYAKVLRLT